MIFIEERATQRVPGVTSLFVSFDYNKNIVDAIKTLETYDYNKKTFEFEVPILLASELLDKLCSLDEISLSVGKVNENDIESVGKVNELLVKYKLPPFDYQIDGIKYGLEHDSFLLLDMPGLGKTAQIIHIAEERYIRGQINHCLIVCGVNTLKTNWKNEIAKHSNYGSIILGEKVSKRGTTSIGSIKERVDHLNRPIDELFIITNIETLRNDEIIATIKNSPNQIDMIVVDEIHCAKSTQSAQGKNLLKLSNIPYKIGATGTLIMNDPLDCYLPLKWIGAEKSTLTKFKGYYCTFGGQFHNIIYGFKHLDSLKDQIDKNSIRRMKDKLNLPPKTIINEFIDMNDEQDKFYHNIEKGIVDEVDKVQISQTSLLALVSRLREATACPSMLTSENIRSAKVDRAIDLIEQIVSLGKKVVVFSTFKETIGVLEKELEKYKLLTCTGDTNPNKIEERKTLFNEDDERKIMLCTWQKMGTGQTLTAASYAIFIDTPWTSAVYKQAQDRVHRIGTKENVTIYNLVTKNTIDERVLEILNDKEAIGDFIVDDKISDGAIDSLRKYISELR